MGDDTSDLLDSLDQLNSAVVSLRDFARLVNRTPATVDSWVKRRLMPGYFQVVPGGRKEFRVAQLKAHFAKRARARYTPPRPRGALMRGRRLERRRWT